MKRQWRTGQTLQCCGTRKVIPVAARMLLAASLAIVGGCPQDPFADKNAATGAASFAVTSTDPAASASGVPVNKQIGVTFTATLDCASVSATSFALSHQNGAVTGATDCTGSQATFRPSGTLVALTEYTATLTRQIRDQSGNTLAADYAWRFTTGAAPDTAPPSVTSTDPANGASNVPVNNRISAVFSEGLDCASVAGNFLVSGPGGNITGNTACSDKEVMFMPSVALATSSPHSAVLKSAIRDSAGNRMAADYTWFFTTAAGPDETPPIVTHTNPDDGDLASTTITLTATFSEPITCDPPKDAFLLTGPGGESVKGKVTCTGDQASFDPDEPLEIVSPYRAALTAKIHDLAGNALAPVSWSFTTGPF